MLGPIAIHTHGPLVGATIAFSKGGASYLTAILKATFAMIHEGVAALVPPHALADEDARLPGLGTLEHASDLAPFIPGVDVVLRGHARATASELTPAVAVRLVLYRRKVLLDKTLHVYGDRLTPAAYPRDFAALPLLYELAQGGQGTENPLGSETPAVANIFVPQGSRGTAGFAPLPRDWPARYRLVQELKTGKDGILELDDEFPFAFFHSAPEDQRVDVVRGDEWILLDGMHSELARFATKLPGAVVQAQLTHENEVPVLFDLCCDTVAIDADDRTVSLVWRGHLPLPRDRAGYAVSARIDIVGGDDELGDESTSGKPPEAPRIAAPLIGGDPGPIDDETPDASSDVREAAREEDERQGPRTHPPTSPGEGSFRDMPFAKPPTAPTFGRAPSEPAPPQTLVSGPSQGLPFRPSGPAAVAPATAPPGLVAPPVIAPLAAPPMVTARNDSREQAESAPSMAVADSRVAPPVAREGRRAIDEPTTASWQDDPTPNEAADEPTALGGPRTLPFKVPPEITRAQLGHVSERPPAVRPPAAPKENTGSPATMPPEALLTTPRDPSPSGLGPSQSKPAVSKIDAPDTNPIPPARVSSPSIDVSPPALVSRMPTQRGGMAVPSLPELPGAERKPEKAPTPPIDNAIAARAATPPSSLLEEPTAIVSGDTSFDSPTHDAVLAKVVEPVSSEPTTKDAPTRIDTKADLGAKAAPEEKAEPEETGIRGAVLAKLKRREAFYDANYAGLDLSGIDFSEAALSGINLAGAKLSGCSFKSARMSGAKLMGADLRDATLTGADLAQADLSRASLERARFDGATLTDANFTLAVGRGASFDGVTGVRATFAQGQWEDATFRGATLTSTDFSGAELSRSIFERALLASARFSDARGTGSRFENGELDQATFTGATLKEASFDNASLQGSSWERATLEGTSFRTANMARAVIARATIGRAIFVDTDLEGANFIGATGDGADFAGAKLLSADLRQTKLGDAGFERADLSKVNAHKAVFTSPRFTDANLTSASFRAAKMKGAALGGADLTETDLRDADLEGAKLKGVKNRASAKLGGANLRGVDDDDAAT